MDTFPIIPAPGRAFVAIAVLSALLLALLIMFAYMAYSSRSARFEVSEQGLRIRGAAYGRAIPMEHLIVEEARAVDLEEEHGLQPSLRTNGIGLPGYRAGWFRLNRGERALLFVTDRSRVVHIPTRDGYSVMLSVERPEDFVASLQRAAGGGPMS